MKHKEQLTKWIKKIRDFGWREWGMVFLIGVCLVVITLPLDSSGEECTETEKDNGVAKVQTEKEGVQPATDSDYASLLEHRLERLLEQVEGVESARVMLTVKSSAEQQILKNEKEGVEHSEEYDSAGGSRKSERSQTECNPVLVDGKTGSYPYITKEIYPEIEGVVVLIQGEGKGQVDLDILTAVQVLFGVPAHKIKIMKMKR